MTTPSDGRITSLQSFTGALAGTELMVIVYPPNSSSGVNYSLSLSVLASSFIPLFPAQLANTVLAGPTSGTAATPSFRALVFPDLPTGTTQTITGANGTIADTDVFIYVNAAGTSNLAMAGSTAWIAANVGNLSRLVVQDISGLANTTSRKITLTCVGSDTINGATSIEIVTPYAGFGFRSPTPGLWVVQ